MTKACELFYNMNNKKRKCTIEKLCLFRWYLYFCSCVIQSRSKNYLKLKALTFLLNEPLLQSELLIKCRFIFQVIRLADTPRGME